jgi:hypothetical protein
MVGEKLLLRSALACYSYKQGRLKFNYIICYITGKNFVALFIIFFVSNVCLSYKIKLVSSSLAISKGLVKKFSTQPMKF